MSDAVVDNRNVRVDPETSLSKFDGHTRGDAVAIEQAKSVLATCKSLGLDASSVEVFIYKGATQLVGHGLFIEAVAPPAKPKA